MSLEILKARLEKTMEKLAGSPYLDRVMSPGFTSKELYAMYMVETYHYTRHNSRNQALVATRDENLDPRYMKFCLKHAEEETGHELMAFHDLKNLGYDITLEQLPEPLQETKVLIAYLYEVSGKENPLARLGYSFWAEKVYAFIAPLLQMASGTMGISKKSMTFFNEHSEIDQEHSKQVDQAIERFAKTQKDWDDIGNCMETSLLLTTRMMDAVFEQFVLFKEGKKTRYTFLQ
jgi:hypothetical protein